MKNKHRVEKSEEIISPRPIENYIIISTPEIEGGVKCIQYNGKWITPEEYQELEGDFEKTLTITYL